MSEGLRGVVVSHGGLAAAMVQAVEQISGVTGVLFPVSNTGCDPEPIERRLAEAVGDGPAVVFVDLPSGSCFFAAMRAHRVTDGASGGHRGQPADAGGFRVSSRCYPPRRPRGAQLTKGGEAIRTR